MSLPLDGIRVLDLTNVLAGPFCCHQLVHMGADVIKVEVPKSGDLARQLGADGDRNEARMGVSFLAQNPGKRSITVNLKEPEGVELLKRLVATADVVVENFRPGVMNRLGVGYQALKAVRPSLIYCAISGFGQDGPLARQPAYDQIIQGMAGVMAITGNRQTVPNRVGYPMADTIGGMTAAFAVAAALAEPAERRGRFIDVSMLESVIATMGWVVSNHLVAGQPPQLMGNDNFTASPSGTFATADAPINIAANKQEQFEAVCAVVGRPEVAADARFAKRADRLVNRAELTLLLEEALIEKGADDWIDAFNTAGVPAGHVLSVQSALAHPQIAQRGLLQTYALDGEELQLVGAAVKLDGQALKAPSPPPHLGANTAELLHELGYSKTDQAKLADQGIV